MNPPLCGDQVKHDHWIAFYWRCPVCARIRHDKEARQAQQDFAALVADAVVERLKKDKYAPQ